MNATNIDYFDHYDRYQLVPILETVAHEEYDIYAEGTGPLTLDQLDPNLVADVGFQAELERVGWPTQEDSVIEPVHAYRDAGDFVRALCYSHHPQYLNNLNAILCAVPTDTFEFGNIYGAYHALRRANLLAPELFKSIHDLFSESYGTCGSELTAILQENELVASQVWKAFKILGRLVAVDDRTREVQQVNSGFLPSPITSAQEYLST